MESNICLCAALAAVHHSTVPHTHLQDQRLSSSDRSISCEEPWNRCLTLSFEVLSSSFVPRVSNSSSPLPSRLIRPDLSNSPVPSLVPPPSLSSSLLFSHPSYFKRLHLVFISSNITVILFPRLLSFISSTLLNSAFLTSASCSSPSSSSLVRHSSPRISFLLTFLLPSL